MRIAGNDDFEQILEVKLNVIGRAWFETLELLEQTEVIVVVDTPKHFSVAPWYVLDI